MKYLNLDSNYYMQEYEYFEWNTNIEPKHLTPGVYETIFKFSVMIRFYGGQYMF